MNDEWPDYLLKSAGMGLPKSSGRDDSDQSKEHGINELLRRTYEQFTHGDWEEQNLPHPPDYYFPMTFGLMLPCFYTAEVRYG